MAGRFLARTAVAQAAILAITAALATTNCSPDGSSTAPRRVACGADSNGITRATRVGETEVSLSFAGASADKALVSGRATRGGQLIFAASTEATSGGKVLDLDVTFGTLLVEGVRQYHLHTDDGGETFTGSVDGRAVLPFAKGAKESRFADDGSIVPAGRVKDSTIEREVHEAFNALMSPDACGASASAPSKSPKASSGIGKTEQKVVKSGSSDTCGECNLACSGVALSISIAATACATLPPPLSLACVAIFFVSAAVYLGFCFGACFLAYCNGPTCGTSPGVFSDRYRCNVGETCANPIHNDPRSRCCPAFTTPCVAEPAGPGVPMSDRLFLCCENNKGESCAPRENKCCLPPEVAVDGACCPQGLQFRKPDGSTGCCTQPLCSDGSCCGGLGVCGATGGCCATPCGGNRCCDAGAGEACLLGSGGQTCCRGAQRCGTRCCADGTVCLDPSLGTCGVSSCPPGTVATRDEATGATICCGSNSSGGCNGACCSFGQLCCGTPAACSTDCIR